MKREGKIIIGIILIFVLVILEVSFIYNRYFEYDEYDVEYASGYTIIDGKEYPFCPDIPRSSSKPSHMTSSLSPSKGTYLSLLSPIHIFFEYFVEQSG